MTIAPVPSTGIDSRLPESAGAGEVAPGFDRLLAHARGHGRAPERPPHGDALAPNRARDRDTSKHGDATHAASRHDGADHAHGRVTPKHHDARDARDARESGPRRPGSVDARDEVVDATDVDGAGPDAAACNPAPPGIPPAIVLPLVAPAPGELAANTDTAAPGLEAQLPAAPAGGVASAVLENQGETPGSAPIAAPVPAPVVATPAALDSQVPAPAGDALTPNADQGVAAATVEPPPGAPAPPTFSRTDRSHARGAITLAPTSASGSNASLQVNAPAAAIDLAPAIDAAQAVNAGAPVSVPAPVSDGAIDARAALTPTITHAPEGVTPAAVDAPVAVPIDLGTTVNGDAASILRPERGDAPSASAVTLASVAQQAQPGVATQATTAVATPTPAAYVPAGAPAEQLVTVLRPLRFSADGTYHLRLELRPVELGRVELRVEMRDGVMHASIHAESEASAQTLRNALGDLRARLDADGVRSGQLTVNDGRADTSGRENGADTARPNLPPTAAPRPAAPITPMSTEQADPSTSLDVRV